MFTKLREGTYANRGQGPRGAKVGARWMLDPAAYLGAAAPSAPDFDLDLTAEAG
jgi:hypothetical protein